MEDLKAFYKNRLKKPDLYRYDEEGNLTEYNRDGGIVKTITLPAYRPVTMDEIKDMETQRMEAIAAASTAFEEARTQLYDEYKKAEYDDSAIFRLNREVARADAALQAIRFPLTDIESVCKVEVRALDFTQPNEIRKYPHPILFYKTNPFSLTDQYTRVGDIIAPVVPLASLQVAPTQVILFEQPDTNPYGFLSLDWTATFTYHDTVYQSAKQAIAAELAKEFNDQDHLADIMNAEQSTDIAYSAKDIPGDTDANEVRWNSMIPRLVLDINLVKFNTYPELKERLLQTEPSMLGAVIPNDTLLGIGLSMDSSAAMVPQKWTGQNLLGKTLMDIRMKIRGEIAMEASASAIAAKVPVRRKRPMMAPNAASAAAPVVAPVAAAVALPTAIQAVPGLFYQERSVPNGNAVIAALDAKGGWQEVGSGASSRKVQQYGYMYNYKSRKISEKLEDIPDFLLPLKEILQTACRTLNLTEQEFNQCLVNDYQPGQGISNHIDSIDFGTVIGCYTLGSGATMTFKNAGVKQSIYVRPNSLYMMSGDARYVWSHEMPAVKSNMVEAVRIPRARRVSVTFRHVPLTTSAAIAAPKPGARTLRAAASVAAPPSASVAAQAAPAAQPSITNIASKAASTVSNAFQSLQQSVASALAPVPPAATQ